MKLRKSLVHSLNIVNVVLNYSSSPRSTVPIESIDIDSKIASQISSLSKNVDDKLTSMSEGLFRQNTYLWNKKHTLTCQGGNWLFIKLLTTGLVVSWRGWEKTHTHTHTHARTHARTHTHTHRA